MAKTDPIIPLNGAFTLDELIACVDRELEKRAKCYPRWVQNHEEWEGTAPEHRPAKVSPWKRTQMRREEAEHEMGAMLALQKMMLVIREMLGESGMDINRARAIVRNMTSWFFYSEGILVDEPATMQYSLGEMLFASLLVEVEGKKPTWTSEDGKTKTREVQMNLDPRLIAAMYTAMMYEGQDPRNGKVQPIAEANGRHIVVLEGLRNSESIEEEEL